MKMSGASEFHIRALRDWQCRESETNFFVAQVMLVETLGSAWTLAVSFSAWAGDAATDLRTAIIALAAEAVTHASSFRGAAGKAPESESARTDVMPTAARKGDAAVHAPRMRGDPTAASAGGEIPAHGNSRGPPVASQLAGPSVERLELELASLRKQLESAQKLSSPPATPHSPPAPPRDADYYGTPVAWPVAAPAMRGGAAAAVTSDFSPAATPLENKENRFTQRVLLSEIKNAFGPRQSGIDKDVHAAGASLRARNAAAPPSWRDL